VSDQDPVPPPEGYPKRVGTGGPSPAMRAAKRTEIAHRRRQIQALHLARVPQKEIARRLEISESLVSKDLRKISEEWKAAYVHDMQRLKWRECAALDADEQRVRARIASVPDVPPLQGITDAESRQAHAQVWDQISRTYCRLQETAIKIMQLRAKLLGLEAPVQVEHTGQQALRVEFVNDWTPTPHVEITEVETSNGNGHAAVASGPSSG
jgi:DNA-binding CsgD family transcriptional regulator